MPASVVRACADPAGVDGINGGRLFLGTGTPTAGVVVRRSEEKLYVLTNDHVAGEAEQINIKLQDGRSYKAKLVGRDENKDLALVMFETRENIPVAEIGDLVLAAVGDTVSTKVHVPERLGQVDRHIGSTDKLERLTGWRARTSFERGLEQTVEWYSSNEWWWRPIKEQDAAFRAYYEQQYGASLS